MTERKCILTGDRADPETLIRLAIGPDGQVLPDVRAKAPGRGAWIGVSRAELETALAKGKLKGAIARSFKDGALQIEADLPDDTVLLLTTSATRCVCPACTEDDEEGRPLQLQGA